MNKIILKKVGALFGHLVFWAGVLLFYTYYFAYGSDNFDYAFSFSLFILPITIATTYVVVKNLIPNYLLVKKYKLFALYSLYTLIISSFLIIISIFYGLLYLSKFSYETMTPISKSIVFIMIGVYSIVIFVSAISLLKHFIISEKNNATLQNKILETQLKLKEHELSYLKSQIHPHFLFNSLNTIYGLALKNAAETPDVILKLSNLLDYILYQVNKPSVSLTDEISHLENYIDLEKIRFKDTMAVQFNKQIDNKEVYVAPMLLLPFVENAFKHGSIIDGFLKIIITISVAENELHFSIKNTYKPTNTKEGIGLKNSKERLKILYPNKHTLQIETESNWFSVDLKINLK